MSQEKRQAKAPDTPRRRGDYPVFRKIDTRWNDNDVYGHLNNVVYYALVDSVINRYLIEEGGLDIFTGRAIGIIPETRCRYRRPLRYPDIIDAGLRVVRLGRTSVVYDVGLFKDDEDEARAEGHSVHVFVDRARQDKTVPIPDNVRKALARIVVPDD